MIPLNPWEHQNSINALYSKCVERVCVKHNITRIELDILLFLTNNPCFDTASDIIEVRYLSKSQVSSSIKLLEQCGYIRKEYLKGNRKTAHLRICKGAMDIIHDGQAAQKEFVSIILDGFSQEEIDSMKKHNDHIQHNINAYLKGKETE